jgi:hypothetical protein
MRSEVLGCILQMNRHPSRGVELSDLQLAPNAHALNPL